MWYALFWKDFRMMASGKFFFVAIGSLILYTVFIRFGYLQFMDMDIYNVYLYDPAGTQTEISPLVHRTASLEELEEKLLGDANGVGIDAGDGEAKVVLYRGAENLDRHRADYALSLLHPGRTYSPQIVGSNSLEGKNRKDITCEFLFIEIVAVGFLGIAAVLFKEKQMGVIRVHAIMPFPISMFVISKAALFLLTDLGFAALMTVWNIGLTEGRRLLPAILLQTAILSLIMALTGFVCTMLLKDFRQFSLAYLVIALFTLAPVFLSANTSIKMSWIWYHPFYHLYMGLKNAFFGRHVTHPVYYPCAVCVILVLFGITMWAFHREMGKEG